MVRKLRQFGCFTITKEMLSWKAIERVKESTDVAVRVFHDSETDVDKYAVISLPKRTADLDDIADWDE